MPRLRAQVFTIDAIDPPTCSNMYGLYQNYYEGCTADRFAQDLANKTHAIVLRVENETLRGFSTLALFDFEFEGALCQAVFSGDTIVHHEFWGEPTLPAAWLELAGQFKA